MTSYNKRRRERDFREGEEERARASEEARRALGNRADRRWRGELEAGDGRIFDKLSNMQR